MDDTEEAQAWIEAVTHDPFDDSLSFLANLKTGARRGVPARTRIAKKRFSIVARLHRRASPSPRA